ncbi:YraN family protein [uncultured Roseobacter sp.]|uniref:YraN family protein n=1 Tax=uncultured Roseobacter sp. TaxID=114847 RepID=UPI0026188A92|nr:YraN family protein [uncultured Roseobacter sp.]
MTVSLQRQSRGQQAHAAGVAAEEIVARQYQAKGCGVLETRWRGPGGEIDLIVQDGPYVVFVEVKKSRSFDAAAVRLGPRQIERLCASAAAYLGTLPAGSLTEARFDVALVNGSGMVRILPNAFGVDG